ncbi:Histone-lysine N-methyltransferase SETMAR, partial [Habropoda laboriosa]
TITAESYSNKLEVQQSTLVNRKGLIILHDNVRPHVASRTIQKLHQLGVEILPHLPYSPDLSPTDSHFFRSLDNFLT